MYCLATFTSGNYAYNLSRHLELKGYVCEVVSTPCHIAKGGCGFSLRFPCEYKDIVIQEGIAKKVHVSEIFRVVPSNIKNKYEKIY